MEHVGDTYSPVRRRNASATQICIHEPSRDIPIRRFFRSFPNSHLMMNWTRGNVYDFNRENFEETSRARLVPRDRRKYNGVFSSRLKADSNLDARLSSVRQSSARQCCQRVHPITSITTEIIKPPVYYYVLLFRV